MSTDAYIAYTALTLSAFSVGTSFYFGYRDRMQLDAKCEFFPAHPDYGQAHLKIRIVNRGRRVAVLTMFGGNTLDGEWQGEHLGEQGRGLHLTEQQLNERKFYRKDIEAIAPHRDSEYLELWFEDSLGRRHMVKHSKAGIRQLKEAERP